jgi:hypothetical protein
VSKELPDLDVGLRVAVSIAVAAGTGGPSGQGRSEVPAPNVAAYLD